MESADVDGRGFGAAPVAGLEFAAAERRRTFVDSDELRRILAARPDPDYALMRAEIDEFFGEDDRIRDADYF